ncbi:transposable element Tcb2 transposase [Trichonephila clavipes]|nr:transposable element Tcb2 transposase [Trichonephila clavipes]
MICVTLTARYRGTRKKWATVHVNWKRNERCNILFSLHPDSRRMFNWRERFTRTNPAFVYVSGLMKGALTNRRYRDEILKPIAIPYAVAIGDDFRLMDDYCNTRHANLVDDFLYKEGIT